MNLNIAISTCPNDIYIFYALIEKKISTNINLKFSFYDIEELNNYCLKHKFDIIKISANLYKKVKNNYIILDAGSALGFNCGPLIVSKYLKSLSSLENKRIGIPGENTTANRLFDIFVNKKVEKIFMRFDKIMPAIIEGKIDAGVIIHEGRFVYKQYNLLKIADLGELWEKKTGKPIPLGIIVAKKNLSGKILLEVNDLIKKSINFEPKDMNFIKNFAVEMDEETIKNHIKLYVNKFSYSLGETGREAIREFLGLKEEKIFLRGEENVS